MSIWKRTAQVANAALRSGSLLPIATSTTNCLQNGIDFQVKTINQNILRKLATSKTQGNPFLPYDEDMFVQRVADHHVCLLNKFPVLAPHILICSNEFIEQRTPLSLQDFEAWCQAFTDGDELGFYNGGKEAGASQPHRHMQLVKGLCPLDNTISNGKLAFRHRLYCQHELSATLLFEYYLQGMRELALYGEEQCQPHNLLLTKDWFVIIPRSKSKEAGVFLIGLNYAGYFLLKSKAQLEIIDSVGCMQILKECSQ